MNLQTTSEEFGFLTIIIIDFIYFTLKVLMRTGRFLDVSSAWFTEAGFCNHVWYIRRYNLLVDFLRGHLVVDYLGGP